MIDERVKKWLFKSLKDYKTIENEFRLPEEDIVTSNVCFHAQQFVEAAYLTFKNKDFGRTHNLEFLLNLCSKEDKDFEKLDVGDLTFYAVEIRYPDEFYTPTLDEAKKAFDIEKKVKDFIFKKLSVKEEDL